ncbi:MAG: GNAT family N-acetyltransferase, partial [Gammaproteobacteria bacterium]
AWLNWVIRVPGDGLAGYVQATVREANVAAIAYVLCSQYWGRGLASQAVEAMLAELAEFYGVQTVLAVVKQQNQRSLRLLQRFGFSRSAAAPGSAFPVQQDEYLMTKQLSETIAN